MKGKEDENAGRRAILCGKGLTCPCPSLGGWDAKRQKKKLINRDRMGGIKEKMKDGSKGEKGTIQTRLSIATREEQATKQMVGKMGKPNQNFCFKTKKGGKTEKAEERGGRQGEASLNEYDKRRVQRGSWQEGRDNEGPTGGRGKGSRSG